MTNLGKVDLGVAASRPGFPAGLKVLVVSNDDVAQLRSSLETYEYCVTTASSCELASQELAAGKTFDVVICESSLVETRAPSKLPSAAASALCAACKPDRLNLPLILLADPGLAARRAVWLGLDLGAAEVVEKPPAESKLRTIWQHAVRKAAAAAASGGQNAAGAGVHLPPSSSAAAMMRRRSISGAIGGGGCSSASLSNNGNGLVPSSGDTSRDSLDSGNGVGGGGLGGAATLHATATSSKSAQAAQAAAAAAAAQARAAAATAARSAAVCRRANSMGSRPAPRKFVARSASAARIGGGTSSSRGSLDASCAAAAALRRAAASDQHLEGLLSNEALRRSLAPMSAPQQPLPPPPPPPMGLMIPLGPGEEACDADDAATSAVAAAMTAGLDITRSLTPPAQIIGASSHGGGGGSGGGAATTPPGCVWGTPLLASTAADAAAAAASTAAAAAAASAAAAAAAAAPAPSYRHYPVDPNAAAAADDCCLAPRPITSFEESSMLTGGSGGAGGGAASSGGLSPAESGGNGSAGGGAASLYHEPPSSALRSPSSAFDVCYANATAAAAGRDCGDVRSRKHQQQEHQQQHGHVPLVDLADALDDVSLALGLPALVPPEGKEDDAVVVKAKGGVASGMPPRGPSLFSSSAAPAAATKAEQQPTSAPLGLSLKKSPSLLDMINERLTSAVCGTPLAP